MIVAPLRYRDQAEGVGEIEIEALVKGIELSVMATELAHIPIRLLRRPVGDLQNEEDAIRRALDRLFTGF